MGRSISDDAERAMITKMKVEVGYTFTAKLEGMFKGFSKSLLETDGRYEAFTGYDVRLQGLHPVDADGVIIRDDDTGFDINILACWSTDGRWWCRLLYIFQ